MRKPAIPSLLHSALPLALALLLCASGPFSALPMQSPASPFEGPAPRASLAGRVFPESQDLQLILQLDEPAVVEWAQSEAGQAVTEISGATRRRARLELQSPAAQAYRRRLEAARQPLLLRLAAIEGTRVEGSVDTLVHAVIVRVPAARYEQVRRLPGIKEVHFSRMQQLHLDTSADLVNAQGLWDRAGGRAEAGRGIKIGVIDSGVDHLHPMFVDSNLVPPAGYPKGEAAFTNSKVIVARNYISLLARRQAVQTATDEVGHGTFVAGIAAGRQVAAPLAGISGMAPGAFLGSYKVFGTPGINDSTTTAAVLAAIDAAAADGMDVITLSLGSLDYMMPADDPEIVALEKAIQSGIIVTISAGNEGPGTYTISNPGATPNAITVGAVSNSRALVSQLRVTSPAPVPAGLAGMIYRPGDNPAASTRVAPSPITDVLTLDGDGLGCLASALPRGSLTGRVALIQRGSCNFSVKAANAATAGASAVIVYNNNPAEGPIGMLVGSAIPIPAVMISNADGLALKEFIATRAGDVQVEIDSYSTLSSRPATPRIMASFSSVGPAPDFSMKPDLVAVGVNVYSSVQQTSTSGEMYDPTGFTVSQGTSFSTPMVAGAAAALKQLFPGFSPAEIKSLLTATASQNIAVGSGAQASVFQAGSGLLDMAAAASAGAVFSPQKLSFGTRSYTDSLSLTREFSIRNISGAADQYTLSFEPIIPGPVIRFEPGTTGSIPPEGSTSISVQLQVSAPLSGSFQGFVVVKSARNGATYRLPYWAGFYVPETSRVLTVSQSGSGSGSYSTLGAALRAARPGNVIEIADSGKYPAGLILSTNADGLPLHGITLRAAAGQSPTLDGSSLTGTPNLTILGLQNVQLQGLTLSGGYTGVLLAQPSPELPLSVTLDRCTISNVNKGTTANGIEITNGGTVQISYSTISNNTGTGILASNAYLTLLSSTVRNNNRQGVAAEYSNVQVLNSTVSSNTGPGLDCYFCAGTIDGSTFAGNRGQFGDGIELSDGLFTVSNNLFDANERAGIGFFQTSASTPGPTVVFSGNTVSSNKVMGVLVNASPDLRMDGNLIKGNAGGVRLAGSAVALLVNNIVADSTDASRGDGVIVAGQSKVRLVNNTIYKNALRGITLATGASVSVINTIISANQAGDLLGLGAAEIQFSLVGDRALTTGNNLTGDPKLADPDTGNYSPAGGSPALDSGSSSAAALPFLDFHQRMRVSPADSAGEGQVDLGAVEANSAYPLIFPVLANGAQAAWGDSLATGVAVLNYGSSSADARFTAFNATGGLLGGNSNPASRTLGAGAQVPVLASQLFGLDLQGSSLGGLVATSLQRLAGFTLLFDSDFSRFADGANATDQTGTDLIFMRHQSDAAGRARYMLFNPGTNPASAAAVLVSSAGTALDAPKTATLEPKGLWVFDFDSTSGSSGYVRVQSDRPLSGLEFFGSTGEFSALAAVRPGTEARLFFPHFAVNQGFSTLLGIVNPTSYKANLILTAYDNEGRQLAAATAVLGPRAQLLQPVSDIFKILPGALATGYVVAESDEPGVQGFSAFRYENGSVRSAAAVPADSVPRQRLLFSHVAHQVPAGSGGSYQTGIALLNPFGTAISYTLRVFDGAGEKVAEKTDILGPRQKVSRILSHPVDGSGFFAQPLPLAGGHIEVSSDYGLLGFELFFTEDLSQLASVPSQLPR